MYDALADGGETTQPLMETFFSPAFGMVTDRFGTPWMISAVQAEHSGLTALGDSSRSLS